LDREEAWLDTEMPWILVAIAMGADETSEYPILAAHADHGDPECPGIIMPTRNGSYLDLKCDLG
jgi:hypothetical protein